MDRWSSPVWRSGRSLRTGIPRDLHPGRRVPSGLVLILVAVALGGSDPPSRPDGSSAPPLPPLPGSIPTGPPTLIAPPPAARGTAAFLDPGAGASLPNLEGADALGESPPYPGPVPPSVDTYFTRSNTPLDFWINDHTLARVEGLVRGFYRNDQRIEWSGLESTFGAEGDLRPLLWTRVEEFALSAEGEFFLNMPYGSSILSDRLRDPYRANFQIDTFELFQLYAQATWRNWRLRIGKTRSPLGNYRTPMFSNLLFDAPFLRTDVIGFTETGLFLRYAPGWFSADLGMSNGEANLDTNSSKAFLGRAAITRPNWTAGVSGKIQDGISSEFHKRRNSFVAFDAAYRWNRFLVYGEAALDQYGFRRDFNLWGNPLNLGVRSLYGRDVFVPGQVPWGAGFDVGIQYRGERLLIDLNYGTYQPQLRLGLPFHDADINRFVGKIDYALTENVHLFFVQVLENRRPREGILNKYYPWAVLAGVQFAF